MFSGELSSLPDGALDVVEYFNWDNGLLADMCCGVEIAVLLQRQYRVVKVDVKKKPLIQPVADDVLDGIDCLSVDVVVIA